jgi:DNA primase
MGVQVNLTLADLESYRSQGSGRLCGRYLRYYCPIHKGDHQRSLSLDPETGRFFYFACGAWGYLEEKKREWIKKHKENKEHKKESVSKPKENHTDQSVIDSCICETKKPAISPPFYSKEPSLTPCLQQVLHELQEALPRSLGEEYLKSRGIPLELAKAFGVGYAAYGKWPHMANGRLVRQWRFGRLVFAHTNPYGKVVNLYGRAIGNSKNVPKEVRHDHLPSAKGVFNAKALAQDSVFVCEGVFDALSLMAAGYSNAVAIFGVDGLKWEWVKAKRLVFCLDQDEAGRKWRKLAWEGTLRGLEIYFLQDQVYAGYKDLNETWVATKRLDIGTW